MLKRKKTHCVLQQFNSSKKQSALYSYQSDMEGHGEVCAV